MSEDLIVTDITGNFGPEFMAELEKELQSTIETEKAQYWVRQSAIAKRERDIGRQILPESLGQKVLSIDSKTWFRWVQDIGYDAMHDAKELDRLAADNPEWRVPGYWNPRRLGLKKQTA